MTRSHIQSAAGQNWSAHLLMNLGANMRYSCARSAGRFISNIKMVSDYKRIKVSEMTWAGEMVDICLVSGKLKCYGPGGYRLPRRDEREVIRLYEDFKKC